MTAAGSSCSALLAERWTGAAPEGAEGVPEEIASSTSPFLLIHPMYTVHGVRMTHIALLMHARTGLVPGLRCVDTNNGMGACPTTLCGQRLTYRYQASLRPAKGDILGVDCPSCKRIAGWIIDGLAPLARRTLRVGAECPTSLDKWGIGGA